MWYVLKSVCIGCVHIHAYTYTHTLILPHAHTHTLIHTHTHTYTHTQVKSQEGVYPMTEGGDLWAYNPHAPSSIITPHAPSENLVLYVGRIGEVFGPIEQVSLCVCEYERERERQA